jgi:hypothetical protein
MTKFIFQTFVSTLFILGGFLAPAFASHFRCEQIFAPEPGAHVPDFGIQVVFSSSPFDNYLSSLMKDTGSESKAAALASLKEQSPRKFNELSERIQAAANAVNVIANYHYFKDFNPRTKSLLYEKITGALLTEMPSSVWNFLFQTKYFAPVDKTSQVGEVLQALKRFEDQGALDSVDRETISDFTSPLSQEAHLSEKKFLRIDNQFALIQLTYKKGPDRANEITNYAMNLGQALHDYDLSLVSRVNDIPLEEIDYVRSQLGKILQELDFFYSSLSADQKMALQTDRVMSNLARHQARLSNEISVIPLREQENSRLEAQWKRLNNYRLAGPY